MCGRFTLYSDPETVARRFRAQPREDENWHPSWNIAPTDAILGVAERIPRDDPTAPPTRLLYSYRWGLLGPWVKDPKRAGSTFNARAETVVTNNTFRTPFRERRLIVPADGYYEWKKIGNKREPHAIRRADGELLAFAGLWQPWRPPDDPKGWLVTATIITGPAGPDTEDLHDRQPVILEPDLWDAWLDPQNDDLVELEAMLRPAPGGALLSYAVDNRVGNVRNNDARLVEPVSDPPSS